jgi:hypothetical protein
MQIPGLDLGQTQSFFILFSLWNFPISFNDCRANEQILANFVKLPYYKTVHGDGPPGYSRQGRLCCFRDELAFFQATEAPVIH